jgi:hypothetical protein
MVQVWIVYMGKFKSMNKIQTNMKLLYHLHANKDGFFSKESQL